MNQNFGQLMCVAFLLLDSRARVMREESSVYTFGPFTLARHNLSLMNRRTRIRLRPQAAALLLLLVERHGVLVSRREIENSLWHGGPPSGIDPGQQINTCIRLIRAALNDRAKAPTYIATYEGGYQFIAPVCGTCGRETGIIEDSVEQIAPSQGIAGQQREPAMWRRTAGTYGLSSVMIGTLVAFVAAAIHGSYGLAILVCCIACVIALVVYTRSGDSAYTRGLVAILLLAVMAYIPSAATLSRVVDTVINAKTLRPAVLYPFITGLKFVPLFFVVLLEWVLRAPRSGVATTRESRRLGYILRAVTVLLVTVVALVWSSGEDRIFRNALPGTTPIALGYSVVLVINIAIWLFGYLEFDKGLNASARPLLMSCIVAYLPLALAGFIVDQEYNSINVHYLDKRRPEAYRAANPEAIEDFRRISNGLASQVGPDLRSLLNDPAFERILRNQCLYKQDFDEMFQIGTRAVMFGFNTNEGSSKARPRFMIVRFPEGMVDALRLQRTF